MVRCPECSCFTLQSNQHGKGIQCTNCGYTPPEVSPKFDYIYRPKMKLGDRVTVASTYHMVDKEDSDLARCGAVRAGEDGYTVVHKDRKLLLSMTCSNCLNRVIVTTKR